MSEKMDAAFLTARERVLALYYEMTNPDGSPKLMSELRTSGIVIALGQIARALDEIDAEINALEKKP